MAHLADDGHAGAFGLRRATVHSERDWRETVGKGDKKTEKGKRFKSSFGKSRPRKAKKGKAKATPKEAPRG